MWPGRSLEVGQEGEESKRGCFLGVQLDLPSLSHVDTLALTVVELPLQPSNCLCTYTENFKRREVWRGPCGKENKDGQHARNWS